MIQDIEKNKRILVRIKKELEPLKKQEAEARRLWTLGYKKYMSATKSLQNRRKKGLTTDAVKGDIINQTVQNFWETIDGWEQKSDELTLRRDNAREAMRKKEEEIIQQEHLLEKMLHEYQIQTQQTDGMVEKVFMLNEGVVAALENMDKFLDSDIFPQLHEKGTQKTIENSQSTKRLVIMTNSINIMDIAMVEEAKREIDAFFERINPDTKIQSEDDTISMLTDLLKELLVVKIKVKAGPSLSRFLGMELNEEKFPELKKAQQLLASATNYSRSGTYVRLWAREKSTDNWVPVRQS
ncbi:MAG: hypothetical protein WCL02_06285 [bacterium]